MSPKGRIDRLHASSSEREKQVESTIDEGNLAQRSFEALSCSSKTNEGHVVGADNYYLNNLSSNASIKKHDFKTMLEGIEQCLDFSKDDGSDCAVLIKLFEQSVNLRSNLNSEVLTTQLMCDYLSCLMQLLRDSQDKLEHEDTFAL